MVDNCSVKVRQLLIMIHYYMYWERREEREESETLILSSFITAAVKLAETRSVVEITMLLCSQVNHYY